MQQQGGKCRLLGGFPSPGRVLPGEGGEGGDNIRESGDEFMVEVTEAKEGVDHFDRFWWGPSRNGR